MWIIAPSRAQAHEFWLEPDSYRPAPGVAVNIAHRTGQNFSGSSYPFIEDWFVSYMLADADGVKPVEGVGGDIPATTLAFTRPGLKVLAYHSTFDTLTFESWQKFDAYLETEGLEHVAPLHRKRGKPSKAIREIYARCAKALIGAGHGRGADRALGLPLELVAEKNPYELKPGEPLAVRLLYLGKPITGIRIKVFAKQGSPATDHVVTDADGRAAIKLEQKGSWLLNAVHMVEPAAGENAHWKSYWASLTFGYGSSSVSQ